MSWDVFALVTARNTIYCYKVYHICFFFQGQKKVGKAATAACGMPKN